MAIANPTYHKVLGTTEIIRLPDKRTWNQTDGTQTFHRFAGTAEAVQRKFNELAAAGSSSGVDDLDEDITGKAGKLVCRVIEDSGTASGGNTEALNAVWEVLAQDILKPIETHTDFNSVLTTRKRLIEKEARDPGTQTLGTMTDAEKSLYGYYANQVLDFMLTEFIIRKTIVASTRSELTLNYASANRVVTLASIDPPSVLIGSLTSLPKMDGTSGQWEWLKKAPQVRQVGKRKFQLVYEWHGAERWAEIYGGSWTPVYS